MVRMDNEKTDSSGFKSGLYRTALSSEWVEITEQNSKDPYKVRATFAAKAAIYAYSEAIGSEMKSDFDRISDDDQLTKLSDLLADLHHLADTFDLDFEEALGKASLYYLGEV